MSDLSDYTAGLSPLVHCFELDVSSDLLDDTGTYGPGSATSGGGDNIGLPLVPTDLDPSIRATSGRWIFANGDCPNITGDLTMIAVVRCRSIANNIRQRPIYHGIAGSGSTTNTNYALTCIGDSDGTVHPEVFHHSGSRSSSGNVKEFTTIDVPQDQSCVIIVTRDVSELEYTCTVIDNSGTTQTETLSYSANTSDGSACALAFWGRPDTSNTQRFLGGCGDAAVLDRIITAGEITGINTRFALGDGYGTVIDEQIDTGERYTIDPQQHGIYHDGTRYWVFQPIDGDLQCQYGAALSSLTDHGDVLTGVDWDGLSCSVVFGEVSGTHYAWVFANLTASEGISARRYELTAIGPSLDQSLNVSQDSGDGHMHAWPVYSSGDVATIYVFRHQRISGQNSQMWMRTFPADLSTSTDGGTWNPSALESPNTGLYMPLDDGVLGFVTDTGPNAAGGQEITMTTVGGSQTESSELGMDNQNYADSTTGQQHASVVAAHRRSGTNEAWIAYKGDEDTDKQYGLLNLWKRGSTVAGSWSQLSSDLLSGTNVWHTAMTFSADGSLAYLFYAKAEGVGLDSGRAIYGRAYSVSSGALGSEVKLADLHGGSRVDVIECPRQALGTGTIVVQFTETDGSLVGGSGTSGRQWINVIEVAESSLEIVSSAPQTITIDGSGLTVHSVSGSHVNVTGSNITVQGP